MNSTKIIIGRNVFVDLIGHAKQVPAKVDTGADSSSVWASNISVQPNGSLRFTLFDKGSSFYDGKFTETKEFSVALVRSSTGHQEIRYRVTIPVRVKGKRIKATFNLSNRSRNHFPILIGRRTLNKKFIVDVTMSDDDSNIEPKRSRELSNELVDDPYEFYQKYHAKDQ